jgi:class 3 adenylate cyclase
METTMESTRPLEIAHVLFMDIVSYSTLPIDQQSEAIKHLQDIVRNLPEFERATRSDQLISLSSGDGMALAFFEDLTAPLRCARDIALNLKTNALFQVRMGIHTGPVYRIDDINANRHLAGGGINFSQRVMDCGIAATF